LQDIATSGQKDPKTKNQGGQQKSGPREKRDADRWDELGKVLPFGGKETLISSSVL